VNKTIKDFIWKHCEEAYPKECCGFIVWSLLGLQIIKGKNTSDTPETHFKLDPVEYINVSKSGKIIGVYHSHPNHTSDITDADKDFSDMYCLPLYAISYPEYTYSYYEPVNFRCELLGRPFAENIFDCLSLIRDFHKQNFNITFPFVPYDIDWIEQGKTYFEDLYESFGFVKVSEPRPSDTVLFKLGHRVTHAAILHDLNTLLHHSEDRLSCKEPFDPRLVKHVYGYFRHKTLI
jgi:proteasome lid subunit RPN8/RPN11